MSLISLVNPTKHIIYQNLGEIGEMPCPTLFGGYVERLLNIDNPYFEGMVNRIYPPELQLNKANTADTEAPFWDLHLSISNGFVSSKIYDFDIVNFPFLDGDVPRSTSYGVYISQLIRFARVSSHVVVLIFASS